MNNTNKNKLYKESLKTIRFYKRELPYIGEMVSSKIMNYSEIGITVFLREYKKEAFMSYNESSSSKKIKNIKKQLNLNKNNILNVQEVDFEKGFIDVSKRSVNEKDQKEYEKLIDKYELIFKILIKTFIWNNTCDTIKDVINFLDKTLWLIEPIRIGEIYESFNNNCNIFKTCFKLDNKFNSIFIDNLKKVIKPKKQQLLINYKINSYDINAIETIKKYILELIQKTNIDIRYISSNKYRSTININEREKIEIDKTIKDKITLLRKNIPIKSSTIDIRITDYKLIVI